MKLSNDQLKMIIWIMQECGTPNVLAFSSLRTVQEKLLEQVGFKPEKHTLSMGNHFYMNHPVKLLSLVSKILKLWSHTMTCELTNSLQDWANPHVWPLMQLYPEIDVPVRECWQAEKWTKESSIEFDTPMWADWDSPMTSWHHYFVHELAQLKSREYVLLEQWVAVGGRMSVDVKWVIRDDKVLT
jgi:hypothetical protein